MNTNQDLNDCTKLVVLSNLFNTKGSPFEKISRHLRSENVVTDTRQRTISVLLMSTGSFEKFHDFLKKIGDIIEIFSTHD